jgi:hypothetical protein
MKRPKWREQAAKRISNIGQDRQTSKLRGAGSIPAAPTMFSMTYSHSQHAVNGAARGLNGVPEPFTSHQSPALSITYM